MKTVLRIIKSELKDEGKAIKELKTEIKKFQRLGCAWKSQLKMISLKSDFRHKHIAYCELKGTPRELIEQPRKGNKPNEDKIQGYKDYYLSLIEEEKEAA